jgi:hypothetical protein
MINISPFLNTWWSELRLRFCVEYLPDTLPHNKKVNCSLKIRKESQLALERSRIFKKLAELQQQKSEMEMQALRAQVIPILFSTHSIHQSFHSSEQ